MHSGEDFKLYCELDAWKSGDGETSMRIGGIVSTDRLDKQGERIIQEGLDFSPFLTEGWFNDNHGQKSTDVLGYPTDARFVAKGERLPTGRSADANGWWVEGYLLNTDEGRKVWGLTQALSKSPRRLGYSIEGKVGKRAEKDPNVIVRATVRNVAITHCPVNTGTELVALAKALTAGSSIPNPGAAPGEGFPLRQESLDKNKKGQPPFSQTGSPANDWESGVEESQLDRLAGDDGESAENGGWEGKDPHTTPVKNPKDAVPPRYRGEVNKAETIEGFGISDEVSFLNEWMPAIQRNLSDISVAPTLTKAEARIIVSERFPQLGPAEVDALIESAQQKN